MLKFVRTMNFQMPDNRRMTDLQVYRDAQGRFVQEEHWEKDIAVPAPYSSGTVEYKRTYLVTKKPGNIQVDTKTKREYVPSCAGDAGTSFQSKVHLTSSIKEKMPIVISSIAKGGYPSKGTVFHTLYRNDTKPVERRVGLLKLTPNLVNKGIELVQIPEISDTYIAKEKKAAQIRFTPADSEQGEVFEESPQSNGQSVRDIIKLFESLNNEKKIKNQESAVRFVHRVTEHGRVRLTD